MEINVLSLSDLQTRINSLLSCLRMTGEGSDRDKHLFIYVYDPGKDARDFFNEEYHHQMRCLSYIKKYESCVLIRSRLEESPLYLLPSKKYSDCQCFQNSFTTELKNTLSYLREENCFRASEIYIICDSCVSAAKILRFIQHKFSMDELPAGVTLKVDFKGNQTDFEVFPQEMVARNRRNRERFQIVVP
jgi:hypothetical protein